MRLQVDGLSVLPAAVTAYLQRRLVWVSLQPTMPDTTPRSIANWVLQEKIGRGSFAVVWKAVHAETGHCVAVKEISTDRLNKKLKQSLESEVSILKQIRHQNIVRLEDVVEVMLLPSARLVVRKLLFTRRLLSPIIYCRYMVAWFVCCRSPAACICSWSFVLVVTWLDTSTAASGCQKSQHALS